MTIEEHAEQNAIIELSKATGQGISKENFYKFVRENDYEKIGPGMYISPFEFADELLVLSKRCPKGVISHDEALFYYGLTDREPFEHSITVYSGYNASRLKKSGYKIFYVDKSLLDLGKTIVVDNMGNEIPMYDMERTIVDMIRNRSKFEIQDFSTAMKTYVKRPEKDLTRLSDYAKQFRVDKILRNHLEVLL